MRDILKINNQLLPIVLAITFRILVIKYQLLRIYFQGVEAK